MPTASTIALLDGQATPVSHDFSPIRVGEASSLFSDKTSTTSAGRPQIVLGFSASSAKRPTNRLNVRFNMPIEQTVDGVTSVAYTARFTSDIVIPDQMTQGQRDDFAAYIKNSFAHTVVASMIADIDPVY